MHVSGHLKASEARLATLCSRALRVRFGQLPNIAPAAPITSSASPAPAPPRLLPLTLTYAGVRAGGSANSSKLTGGELVARGVGEDDHPVRLAATGGWTSEPVRDLSARAEKIVAAQLGNRRCPVVAEPVVRPSAQRLRVIEWLPPA